MLMQWFGETPDRAWQFEYILLKTVWEKFLPEKNFLTHCNYRLKQLSCNLVDCCISSWHLITLLHFCLWSTVARKHTCTVNSMILPLSIEFIVNYIYTWGIYCCVYTNGLNVQLGLIHKSSLIVRPLSGPPHALVTKQGLYCVVL